MTNIDSLAYTIYNDIVRGKALKKLISFVCTAALLLSFWSCSSSSTENTEVCDHIFGDWQVTVRSPDGMIYNEERTCELCGEKEVNTVHLEDCVPEEWIKILDRVIADKSTSEADIFYMSYTSSEDRKNRSGTAVEYENQIGMATSRIWMSIDSIPAHLKTAFDMAMPSGFFSVSEDKTEENVYSTIARTLLGETEFNAKRLIALESKYTKPVLLEVYYNTLRFSDKINGISDASMAYFSKSVTELTLAETVALAAAATSAECDPYTSPEVNKEKREAILLSMKDSGKINEEEYNQALAQVIEFTPDLDNIYSWYTEIVIKDAISLLCEKLSLEETEARNMLYRDGLKIYTVMDPDVQRILEEFYLEPSNFMSVGGGTQPQSSMIITDPATGDILGLVGCRGAKNRNDLPNYADGRKRSPGSTIKPVCVYGPNLEHGLVHYSTIIDDSPYTGDWPSNWPEGYRGPTPVYDAITRSVNTVAVKLLMNMGVARSYEFAHDKLGIHSIVNSETDAYGRVLNDRNASALALGGMLHGLTVRELIGAYQIFDNNGVFTGNRTILKIEDRAGNVIVDNEGIPSQVMSAPNSSIMTKMLESVVDRGTASALTLDDKVDCAGKTGTTSYDHDRWFMGYTPYYMGGVWFGYENPRSLAAFSEIKSPAIDVWDKVMTKLHEEKVYSSGEPLKTFELNEGVITKEICSSTGKLANASCGNRITTGYYTEDNMPTDHCNWH